MLRKIKDIYKSARHFVFLSIVICISVQIYIFFLHLSSEACGFYKDRFPRGERNIAIYILSFSPTPNYKHPRESNCLVHTVQNSGSLFEDFKKSTYQK